MKNKNVLLMLFVFVLFSTVTMSCSQERVDGTVESIPDSSKTDQSNGTDQANEKDQTNETDQTNDTSNSSDLDQTMAEASGQLVKEEPQRVTLVELPYEPEVIVPKVAAYEVADDLGNIVNLDKYPELSEVQRELLVKNAFFVMPSKEEQLFYIYENNEYEMLPNFITTDSVLQVYHVFFNYSLRTLETENFLGLLTELNDNLLGAMIKIENTAQNDLVKKSAKKNIQFLGVCQLLLESPLPNDMPQDLLTDINKEVQLIDKHEGFMTSPIFATDLDYSQYTPRGHYTRTDELTKYFKAMMWYGNVPYPLNKKIDGQVVKDVEKTTQAILMTHALYHEGNGSNSLKLWDDIYETTKFYVGASDDLSGRDYKLIMDQVYGQRPQIDAYGDEGLLDKFYKGTDILPEPLIQGKYTMVTTPVGKQFRMMGQRFVPDAEIFQTLVEPISRPIPRGLDVMAALGSERSEDLLLNLYEEGEKNDKYLVNLQRMKEKYVNLDQTTWQSNMYYGWLWTLKGLINEFGQGYPSFMRNQAWQDKSLSTALASWAELKHDTVLYGKQSGAECGGGWELPDVKAYVEPNLEVYEKLLWLNTFSRENLAQRGLISEAVEVKLIRFDELLKRLIYFSKKELNNESFTPEEYNELHVFGGQLEQLTASFAGDGLRWFEITSDADRNMAVIADVHTIAPNLVSSGGYLQVGVGPAHEIYVVVPIDGSLYLTKGAVFSYHEFISGSKRLTDQEWQDMIKEGQEPMQAPWIRDYMGIDE